MAGRNKLSIQAILIIDCIQNELLTAIDQGSLKIYDDEIFLLNGKKFLIE